MITKKQSIKIAIYGSLLTLLLFFSGVTVVDTGGCGPIYSGDIPVFKTQMTIFGIGIGGCTPDVGNRGFLEGIFSLERFWNLIVLFCLSLFLFFTIFYLKNRFIKK